MISSFTTILIVGLAVHNGLATPLPSPDCALQAPSPCSVYPHGGMSGTPLPPRAITVDSTSTSTSSASVPAPTCTNFHGPVPIGTICFTSGPRTGECISIECLDQPDTCGCPGAPPPVATKEKRGVAAPLICTLEGGCNPTTTGPVTQSSTSTSTVTPPAPTCTNFHGPIPIGEVCFISGPRAGECISIECLDRPDTCGCPGAPPPAAEKEKRVVIPEPIGSSPGCAEPVCESCPFLTECISDVKRSPQENCHHVACDGGLTARSGENGICSCLEPDNGIA